MRKVLLWVVPVIVVAGIAIVFSRLEGGLFHGSPSAQQTSWIAVAHPPGDRPQRDISLIKEFGPWHLACINRAQPVPKVGYIQNFGITSDQSAIGKPAPCHVFITMRERSDPRETMTLGFRYRMGVSDPDVTVMYLTENRPNARYDSSGQILDPSKDQKFRGGFFMGQREVQNSEYQETKSQDVKVQLSRQSIAIPTRLCARGHCMAALLHAPLGTVDLRSVIVVYLPGKPHAPPRLVEVPSDGLDSAIAELRRLSTS